MGDKNPKKKLKQKKAKETPTMEGVAPITTDAAKKPKKK